jgi:hypothetical protein
VNVVDIRPHLRLRFVPTKPLDLIDEQDAIRLAGANSIGCESDEVVVTLGDDAVVIIAEPMDAPGVSGVRNHERFHLHGPFVADVGIRLFGYPPTSPHWSWTQRDDPRPIYLLVRLPEGCLYLGVCRPQRGKLDDGLLYEAELTIEPALSTEALDRVRPPSEPGALPGLEWLPDVTDNPRAALDRFVRDWIPETNHDLGEPDAGRWNVPEPLADYYRLARRRPALLGVQNYIDPPERWLERLDGLVSFAHENQGGFAWLFNPRQEDPEVWIDGFGDGRVREHVPLSGFLLQFALFETMMNMPYGNYFANADPDTIERVTGSWTPLPWAPWRWPNDSTRFFVAPGLIATTSQDSFTGPTIMVRAVHGSLVEDLEHLRPRSDNPEGSEAQADAGRGDAEQSRWDPIDREIFSGRKIQAIQLIREQFGSGIHEALDILIQRYDRLRHDQPAAFVTDTETYWDGFYS